MADLCADDQVKLCVNMQPWVLAAAEEQRDSGGGDVESGLGGRHREATEGGWVV